MLVLTRYPDEVIRIGGEVTIVVLGVKGNQVRLGISAPLHVTVDREEVHDRKQKEKREQEATEAATPRLQGTLHLSQT